MVCHIVSLSTMKDSFLILAGFAAILLPSAAPTMSQAPNSAQSLDYRIGRMRTGYHPTDLSHPGERAVPYRSKMAVLRNSGSCSTWSRKPFSRRNS
jgi:hypothetical protein